MSSGIGFSDVDEVFDGAEAVVGGSVVVALVEGVVDEVVEVEAAYVESEGEGRLQMLSRYFM